LKETSGAVGLGGGGKKKQNNGTVSSVGSEVRWLVRVASCSNASVKSGLEGGAREKNGGTSIGGSLTRKIISAWPRGGKEGTEQMSSRENNRCAKGAVYGKVRPVRGWGRGKDAEERARPKEKTRYFERRNRKLSGAGPVRSGHVHKSREERLDAKREAKEAVSPSKSKPEAKSYVNWGKNDTQGRRFGRQKGVKNKISRTK